MLHDGTDRVILADIQKFGDIFTIWLIVLQINWVVRRCNPDLRAPIPAGKYFSIGTKEPLSLHMCRNGQKSMKYPARELTNGMGDANEPLAPHVIERKFGQATLHHPGREDGRPRLRNSAARSGSGKIFAYYKI